MPKVLLQKALASMSAVGLHVFHAVVLAMCLSNAPMLGLVAKVRESRTNLRARNAAGEMVLPSLMRFRLRVMVLSD